MDGLHKPATLLNHAVHQHGDHKFKTELIGFKLLTNESVAYKARLKQSRVIIYSWAMDDGKFHYGCHAEPDKGPKGY